MYVYYCNAILTTAMKNKSDMEMIQYYTEFTTDLKIRKINLGFHFMDNEASTALKMAMKIMNMKYQLLPPSYHRANNAERATQNFKNYFIAGLCRVDKYFHLQM